MVPSQALVCGNTFILKPSERVPLTARKLFALLAETGLPPGGANLVIVSKPAVDALLDHPKVRAISFVGSTPVARYIYAEGSARGKRVQCQGGAKNHVVILPDADMQANAQIVSDSAFGCAGQRCLAVSVCRHRWGRSQAVSRSHPEHRLQTEGRQWTRPIRPHGPRHLRRQ